MNKLKLLTLALGLYHATSMAQSHSEADITCPKDDENAVFTLEDENSESGATKHVQCVDGVVRRVQGVLDDKRHGDNLLYAANGQLVRLLQYKNAERHGDLKVWDNDGNLTRSATFKNNQLHGEDSRYTAAGELEFKGSYDEGKRVGTHNFFNMPGNLSQTQVYDDKGDLISQQRFDESGTVIFASERVNTDHGDTLKTHRYYSSGEPKQVTLKADDSNWQLRQSFAEDGTLTERIEHLNGKQTGDFVRLSWGGVMEYGHYEEGKLEGAYHSENEHGDVMSEGNYEAGVKVGRWVEATEHDKIIAHYNANGDYDGLREEYDGDGNLVAREHYDNGVLHGEYLRYRDESVIAQGEFVQGKREGEWTVSLFYTSGYSQQGEYRNDKQIGRWEIFNENGHRININQYDDDGKLHGRQLDFEANGAISVLKEYRHGLEHGIRLYYHQGHPERAVRYEEGYYAEDLNPKVLDAFQ